MRASPFSPTLTIILQSPHLPFYLPPPLSYSLSCRLQNPAKYQGEKEKYFQKAWSGAPFGNKDWADQHGDGRAYTGRK